MIRENEVHQIYNAIETNAKEGMFTLNASLYRLWRENIITREVALNKSNNVKQLLRFMEHGYGR